MVACGEGFVDYSVLHEGVVGEGRFEVVRCRVVRGGDAERGVYPVLQVPGGRRRETNSRKVDIESCAPLTD